MSSPGHSLVLKHPLELDCLTLLSLLVLSAAGFLTLLARNYGVLVTDIRTVNFWGFSNNCTKSGGFSDSRTVSSEGFRGTCSEVWGFAETNVSVGALTAKDDRV